ncbi:MAG: ECF transporter S component [Clostridia bacterium]|nr:ECF transporter S component [Clostridia bacterium]
MNKTNTKDLVLVALFSAVILIMAFTPMIGYIPLGFTRATIIHIPVIIGSVILGPKKGAFLGFLFGLTSLINNTINPTVTSFAFTPFFSLGNAEPSWLSLIVCFVPRILVGVVPYYVRKLTKKASDFVSFALAGLLGSLTNTILVMNLIYLFFKESYAAAQNKAVEVLYSAISSIIVINGVPEAIVAAVITLAICKALTKALKTEI